MHGEKEWNKYRELKKYKEKLAASDSHEKQMADDRAKAERDRNILKDELKKSKIETNKLEEERRQKVLDGEKLRIIHQNEIE